MRFVFKARTQEGEVREGIVEAVDRAAAIAVLQREHLIPITVHREKTGLTLFGDVRRSWEGLSQKDLSIFFRELATLIHAKVPIVQALRAIHGQIDNRYLRFIIKDVATDVADGMALSDALAQYPKAFSNLIVSVIRAGETSGNLDNSIMFISESLQRSYQLSARIRSALFYPMFVLVTAGVIGFLTVTFILPKLTQVIKDFDIPDIPWYTTAVMAFGDFMAAYWWAVLLVIVGIVAALWYYINTEGGRQEWDHVKLQLPVFGKLFRMIYMARFAQNFSLLMAGGIPIVKALYTVADVVDNVVYKNLIIRAAEEVKAGGAMSTVFAQEESVSPMVVRMIKIGEDTGKIDETLKNVGEFYEEEIAVMTRNLTTMLEPVLIVFLGIGVAILVISILLPIYNIAGGIS